MSTSVLSLNPQETYEFIVGALDCRQVPYIAGPPAIGKSQVVQQVAEDANAEVIDLRLSQILSEDMTGLPERNEKTGKAEYLPFSTFPLEGDEVPEGKNGWILFLDELSSASEEVLAASYSLILDRKVGGRKLHPKCLVIAAGNRGSDSAIARELPDTLITRMLPINMSVSVKSWLLWAKNCPNKNENVVSFIEKNKTLLYAPTAVSEREELETYPTPRGWEKVFAHVNHHEKKVRAKNLNNKQEDSNGIPIKRKEKEEQMEPLDDITFNLISAAVGFMAARTFRDEYEESISLPFPWEAAQSPVTTRIPNTHIGRATLVKNVAEHFIDGGDQTQDALLTYMNRMPEEIRELFCQMIKDHNSSNPTSSSKKIVDNVYERLSIDPLFGKGLANANSTF